MERIRLDRLWQPFNSHRSLPRRITQPKRRLDARHLSWKERRRDFGQSLGALGCQSKTRVCQNADMSPNGPGSWNIEARQNPARSGKREILLQAQLNDLPA